MSPARPPPCSPRPASGYSDLDYSAGDEPAKTRACIRTLGTLVAEGELNRVRDGVEFKTDDMTPGQEVEVELEAVGGHDCPATVSLSETTLD